MKTSLIIGTGFLGTPLAERLKKHSKVVIVDNFVHSDLEDLPKDLEVITGDAKSYNVLKTVFDRYKPNNVFIFCGRSVDKDGTYDYILERELLEGVALNVARCVEEFGVDNIFFASSSSVYGKRYKKLKIKETDKCLPSSMSGESFRSVENFLRRLCMKCNFGFYSLRYFIIIGNRKHLNAKEDVVSFIHNELKVGNPVVLCRPNEFIDVLCLEDAIDATMCIFENYFSKPAAARSEAFNIGSGRQVKLSTIYKKITKKLKTNISPCVVSDGDEGHIVANIEKLKSLGWKPKYNLDYCIEKLSE